MGFDRGRKGERGGRGRDKRDGGFGEDSFTPERSSYGDRGGGGGGFAGPAAAAAAAAIAARGGGDRFGGGGGGGGGFRGPPGGGGGGGMPPQVVGEGKGVVKFFNPQKGFGFVVRDDGGEDVFVHISAVEQAGLTDLADGQPLEFTLVDRGGRVSATNLKIEGEPMEVNRSAGPPRDREAGGFGGGDRGPQRQLTGEKASGNGQVLQRDEGLWLHPAR